MEKKKVGGVIVSDLNHTNYGSFLQAYATMKVVQNLGYDLTFIKYKKQRSLWEKGYYGVQYLLSGGFEWMKRIRANAAMERTNPAYKHGQDIRRIATNKLKEIEFVPYFKEYVGYNNLCKGSKEYDVCFVGSDQTWRPIGFYSNYWNLNFVDDSIPKFSYAASYGVSSIPMIQRSGTKKYLERIDMISVREQKGKEIVETYSNKIAQVVADPTMLLTQEQWMAFASHSEYVLPKEKYIFCYFLGNREDIREEAKKLAAKEKLKIVTFRHMDEFVPADERLGDFAPYDINAQDFLKFLMNAEYVCTDSFHGTVFSIIMHKKFVTFYRTKPTDGVSTHSRIDSLLAKFGVTDRLFNDNVMKIANNIDFNLIDRELELYRTESLDFFKRALAMADK